MLPCEAQDPLGALRQEQGLAVLAAFFCLLFFAAAKKSRCRPAQGRRLKLGNNPRMPAKPSANRYYPNAPQRQNPHNNASRSVKPLPQTKSVEHTRSTIRFPPAARANPIPAAPGNNKQL